jgi:signal transduction histidine kinase
MSDRAQRFNNLLWTIEGESAWQPEDISNPRGGIHVLRRYLDQILSEIQKTFPEVEAAYAAISGIEPGTFKPIAVIGRSLDEIPISRTSGPTTLASQVLLKMDRETVALIDNPAGFILFRGSHKIRSKVLIKLDGYGEVFGFISLDTTNADGFSKRLVEEMKLVQPGLSRVLAESVFSMRLWDATLSFDNPDANQTLQNVYESISERTLLALAATGAVIRVFDPATGRLVPVEFLGPHTSPEDDTIMEFLLSERSPGEQIAQKVFNDPMFHWTIGMLQDKKASIFSGTEISGDDEDKLRAVGIHAYGVFRLQSELSSLADTQKRVGTLSFFHRHPRRYSWRDIALANALTQRAADLIALHRQNTNLTKTRDELSRKNQELQKAYGSIELESGILTRVEVVSLLSHDLGHKALAVESGVEKFIAQVSKALRENRQFGSISNDANKLKELAFSVRKDLYNINQLFNTGTAVVIDQTFALKSVVEEVFKTLEEPLERNDLFRNIEIPESVTLLGNRSVLLQIFFNLVINSIDAQKMRRNPRRNTIHIQAALETGLGGSPVVVKFWDEGPGINQSVFPNPDKIFELGATSKSQGTGRGLPISRYLLNVYFAADMELTDPRTAHFRLRFPKLGAIR